MKINSINSITSIKSITSNTSKIYQYIIPFIEATYIIYMWNFFKTTYAFHNIWETSLMSHKNIPDFFKHQINISEYSSKICPLGNLSAYLLAIWILLTRIILPTKISQSTQETLKTANKTIFIITAILAFIMNLNAFIYLIPVFIYELFLR